MKRKYIVTHFYNNSERLLCFNIYEYVNGSYIKREFPDKWNNPKKSLNKEIVVSFVSILCAGCGYTGDFYFLPGNSFLKITDSPPEELYLSGEIENIIEV